jgi:cyclase
MLSTRVMPCLLLKDEALVKTVRFRDPAYIGDPVNAVKIYNAKEVDELVLLDIAATVERRQPCFDKIGQIAGECFMPLSYGGGVASVEQIRRLFRLGVEKVIINSAVATNPLLIRNASEQFGSQSIVVAIDAKADRRGDYVAYTHSGTRSTRHSAVEWAQTVQNLGAGEILLNAIDRDGTMKGFDLVMIRQITRAVSIPVIACGGAATTDDIGEAVTQAGASAVAIGSMAVYQGRNRAVLINFPERRELEALLAEREQ